jgi:hypothetical protein
VDWYSEEGYGLWNPDKSTLSKLILEAPTLPGGWQDRIILRVRVSPAVQVGTQLTNTVELDIPVGFASHTRDDVWVRGPYWDAHVDKFFDWGTLVPGHQAGFNVHMRNGGNQPAQTWLTDTLPAGTSLAESWRWDGQQSVEWPPDHQVGQTVVWDMGEMLPGQWYNLDLRLDIDPGVPPNTDLENCAEIGVDGDDRNPFNDQDCATVTVREPGPNMRVYKEHEWQDDDNVLRYEIRVENVGTERLENLQRRLVGRPRALDHAHPQRPQPPTRLLGREIRPRRNSQRKLPRRPGRSRGKAAMVHQHHRDTGDR